MVIYVLNGKGIQLEFYPDLFKDGILALAL